MKYRRKPVMVEAIQWTGHNYEEILDWSGHEFHRHDVDFGTTDASIKRFPHDLRVAQWDYIVRGDDGIHFPCKPDIFKQKYEAISEAKIDNLEKENQELRSEIGRWQYQDKKVKNELKRVRLEWKQQSIVFEKGETKFTSQQELIEELVKTLEVTTFRMECECGHPLMGGCECRKCFNISLISKAKKLTPESPTSTVRDSGECKTCNGDGIARCDNPDHGFIDAVGGETGRLGCPVCGHDPEHKVKGEKCYDCNGTGKII